MAKESFGNRASNQAVVGTLPRCGSTPHTADVSLIKTMWNKVVGQGGQREERPKKSVSVGTRSVLDGSMNRNKFGSANKAVKVQNPADGVLPLTADVGATR